MSKRGRKPRPLAERIWERVEKTDGCWLWTGTTLRGYGVISVAGLKRSNRVRLVHRLVYELEVGPIPVGLGVLHRCDVPACVRPTHLFLGTPADNTADMDAKGRAGRHKRRKLTPEQVVEVLASRESSRALAARLPMSDGGIRALRRRGGYSANPFSASADHV